MEHKYISTYCIHDLHEDCRKVCKHCTAHCLCWCHRHPSLHEDKPERRSAPR